MTAHRPYRAGLGLPEAVVIRSAPLPPQPTPPVLPITTSSSTRDPTWHEWHVNAAQHGPEHTTRPPVFLPSQSTYDELGRSLGDGVEVEVDEGKRRAVEGGEDVASWYKALAGSSSNMVIPVFTKADGPSSPTKQALGGTSPSTWTARNAPSTEAGPSRSRSSLAAHTPRQPTPAIPSYADNEAPPHSTRTAPVKINKREWFIRRALLTSSRSAPSPPAYPPKPSSISALLELPAQPRAQIHHYTLGPSNKGYSLLRDRLGWEGGGLGRPEGWDPSPALRGHPVSHEPRPKMERDSSVERNLKKVAERVSEGVIDLTADTDSDIDPIPDAGPEVSSTYGPGRTAPIATSLKLDRLGIGYQRARSRGSQTVMKKVTHSAAEIREAQRRARLGQKKGGGELGKRGKVKWKERNRREREERKRLGAMVNA